jgi:hypothetical protein
MKSTGGSRLKFLSFLSAASACFAATLSPITLLRLISPIVQFILSVSPLLFLGLRILHFSSTPEAWS